VNAKGQYGIAGYNGSKEKFLVRNATVTAEGKDGSICDFASLTLEYYNITQPSGATFDESKYAVVLNGEVEDFPKGIYIVNGKKFVKK
jgi:arginine-specific protease argI polyprotein